jgi:hypothetical protein
MGTATAMNASDALALLLPTLVKAIESGALSPETESEILESAFNYAVENRLPFDGTLKGAVKLAEEARRTVTDFMSRQQVLQRQGREDREVIGEGYEHQVRRPN